MKPSRRAVSGSQSLGVSAASLRSWSNQGLVPVYRTPGGQRRFSTTDLDRFIRSMREPSENGQSVAAMRG